MVPPYLIPSKIQGKITGQLNIGHSDLQKYEVTRRVTLNKEPKYDICLFDRGSDIRQNPMTIIYGSQLPINNMRSMAG